MRLPREEVALVGGFELSRFDRKKVVSKVVRVGWIVAVLQLLETASEHAFVKNDLGVFYPVILQFVVFYWSVWALVSLLYAKLKDSERYFFVVEVSIIIAMATITTWMLYTYQEAAYYLYQIYVIPLALGVLLYNRRLLFSYAIISTVLYVVLVLVNNRLIPYPDDLPGFIMSYVIIFFCIVLSFDTVHKQSLHLINIITEQNKMLERQNALLEQRVKERTRELEKANERLRYVVNRDGLTGVFNKYFLEEQLERHVQMAVQQLDHPDPELRSANNFCLLIFDIDYFKHYNDQNGHLEGDNLLKELSNLVKEKVRESDMVFRFGGEEFVVLLPNTPREKGKWVAEKIVKMVEKHEFAHQEKQPNQNLTISMGFASFPEDGLTKEALLKVADDRLYLAKQSGRNRVCFGIEKSVA